MRGHDPSTVSGAGAGAVGVMTPSDCVAVKADEPLLGTHAPSDVRTMRESTMFMECTSARIGVVPEEVQQKCEGESVSNFTGACDWITRGLTVDYPWITRGLPWKMQSSAKQHERDERFKDKPAADD